jgi:hypothetical protein
MSTINYTYNVIVDRFRQFADGHFQLRRFTHGEISQADLEKEAEWPWMHVKPRAINYAPGTRAFSFEIFISDLPRDKEDKTGYQAESITDCSLIFQDLINEIHLGHMFGDDVVLTRPVNSEPFVEQYTHTLTGVTGTIELSLDYDWSACSIPASWNYNTPTNSPSDGWGALQFIESLDQNGVFVSLLNDLESPGNSYYYGTDGAGIKGWYAIVDNIGLTCETLPNCAVIISIEEDIAALQAAAITNTSQLVNDGEDGVNPFITAQDLPSLTGYVPYTGATQDVNLGEFELKAGQVEFDQTPTGTAGVAVMRWNDSDGTLDLGLKGGNVTLQVGQESVLRVVNKTATNVNLLEANYQAVRVTGAQGQRLKVDLALATSDPLSAETIGLVTETINNNQEGFITTSGLVRGINTTGSLQGETWADGDILYLSPTTAGNATKVKPVAPNHLIVLGYVIHAHITQGSIFVKVDNGYELDELHNVKITTAANNNVLAYTSATDIWENKTVATALGFTPVPSTRNLTINGTTQDLSADRTFTIATGLTVGTTPITSGTVGQVLFQGTGNVLQESANLFWNNTTNRFGVGTSTPTLARLQVKSTDAYATTPFAIAVSSPNEGAYIGGFFNDTKSTTIPVATYFGWNNGDFNMGTLQGKFFLGAGGDLSNGSTTRMTIHNATGNIGINTTTDAGYKLDVNGTARLAGDTIIKGTGSTNATFALRVQNSSGTDLLTIKNANTGGDYNLYAAGGARLGSIEIVGSQIGAGGGATISFAYNPIMIGGTSINTSAQFQMDSTTRGFLPPRMTTTQKNAIATPASGLVVYDTTLGKLCVRGAAAWETITSI